MKANKKYIISFYNDDNKDWDYGQNEKLALREALKLIEQKESIQLTEINYTTNTQKIILSYGFEPKPPELKLTCVCGNRTYSDGFYPCDKNGEQTEPDEEWEGLYVCDRCGKIYDSKGTTYNLKNEEVIKIKIYPCIGEVYYVTIPKKIYDADMVEAWINVNLHCVDQWEYAEANKKLFPEEKYCKKLLKEYLRIFSEENPSNAKDFIEYVYNFVKTKKEELL